MSKLIGKVVVGTIVGLGVGLFVGKRKIRKLETERSDLLMKNDQLRGANEDLEMNNNNLKMVNQMMRDYITQEEA